MPETASGRHVLVRRLWAGRYEVVTSTEIYTVVRSETTPDWNLFLGQTCNDDAWLGDFPTKAAAVRSIR